MSSRAGNVRRETSENDRPAAEPERSERQPRRASRGGNSWRSIPPGADLDAAAAAAGEENED